MKAKSVYTMMSQHLFVLNRIKWGVVYLGVTCGGIVKKCRSDRLLECGTWSSLWHILADADADASGLPVMRHMRRR